MKGTIYKRKGDWVIVFNRPAMIKFIPVTGPIKNNVEHGDVVEFDIEGEKVGKAKIIKYITQRPEADPGIEYVIDHLKRVREDKRQLIQTQQYARAAACREVEKCLEAMLEQAKKQNGSTIKQNEDSDPFENITYYPRYDVYVDTITGKLSLPICSCRPQEDCIFMNNWIADGRPEAIDPKELECE